MHTKHTKSQIKKQYKWKAKLRGCTLGNIHPAKHIIAPREAPKIDATKKIQGEDNRPAHEQLETQLKQLEHDRPAERACKIIDNEITTEYT